MHVIQSIRRRWRGENNLLTTVGRSLDVIEEFWKDLENGLTDRDYSREYFDQKIDQFLRQLLIDHGFQSDQQALTLRPLLEKAHSELTRAERLIIQAIPGDTPISIAARDLAEKLDDFWNEMHGGEEHLSLRSRREAAGIE